MSIFIYKTIIFCAFLINFTLCKTSEIWRKRSVYQVLTDRFSNPAEIESACADLSKYCGGTWNGITEKLDYIQNMGFDAIWISPIFENSRDGYHGYWTTDFEKVNSHFGSEQDLANLVQEAHKRDILVMVDVVANHVSYLRNFNEGSDGAEVEEDFSMINPFNSEDHYHEPCVIQDWTDHFQLENCRLAGLPDLK